MISSPLIAIKNARYDDHSHLEMGVMKDVFQLFEVGAEEKPIRPRKRRSSEIDIGTKPEAEHDDDDDDEYKEKPDKSKKFE